MVMSGSGNEACAWLQNFTKMEPNKRGSSAKKKEHTGSVDYRCVYAGTIFVLE